MQLEELASIDIQVEDNVAKIADSVRSINKIKSPIRVPAAIIVILGSRFYKCNVIVNVGRRHYDFRLYSIEEVSSDEYLDTYLNMHK